MFWPHREIGERIKSSDGGMQAMKKSTKFEAHIGTRDTLIYNMHSFGAKFYYLPPLSGESTLFLDYNAIALGKEFMYKKEFNKLYYN